LPAALSFSAAARSVAQQVRRVSGDRGGVEFVDGQVIGKAHGPVRRRRLVLERIEALVGQRGPRGFDIAEPMTNA